jgi:hypothetical protein
MDDEEFYVPDGVLQEASATKYQMVPTIPERIGNIYLHNGRPRNGSREKTKML